ncbi:MAG: SDR family oxidoreductase [Candidatus Omnitrophica bacterium]|nr:SDR family oxidoreductase [Candidatus Omnitrophota bacterium]
MDLGIKGKRVLITGGSKGIGAAIAKDFSNEGAKVSIVSRNEERLKKEIDELGGAIKGHEYIVSDLRDGGEPTRVAREMIVKHKKVDIVVHNVGGALGEKNPLGKVEDYNAVWQFNVGIAIEMNAVLVPEMKKQGWGRVVHVSSISAELGEPLVEPFGGALPYAAAKAYLNAYIRGLGREMAKDNVVVTGVMPGAVLSEGKYWDKLKDENPQLVDEFLNQHYPIGRFADAEEISSFVVFLASDEASFAAGSVVSVSGGRV